MASTDKGAVLITGASTGIGRATALYLDERGYRVFAGVRKKRDADSLAAASATGNLTPVTIDVTKPASIAAARQKVQRAVGKAGLEGLVNNAGVANAGPVEYLPVEDFQAVIDVNLTGQYAVTQAFLPLVRRGEGTIVFVTSIGGKVASPFFSPYNASKFGLEGVADALRREIKPWKMDVVVIEPGSIATEIWERGTNEFERAAAKLGPEAKRLYGRQLEAMKRVMAETAARGIDADEVAQVIERSIRSSNPRARYRIGRDAKIMYWLQNLFGAKNFDTLMRRSLKLPNDAPKAR
jgi:NAD(P)-dependent dehydrogenase (short-subunit alcohol dehydrogenase family)